METTIIKPEFVLGNGVRTLGASSILTSGVKDMIDEISADGFRLVENAEGTKYLHIVNSGDEKYFSIKVGKTVDSKKRGNDLITDLISNYVVYCGATENGTWFTFGRVGATGDPIAEMTLKQLVALKVKFYAGS